MDSYTILNYPGKYLPDNYKSLIFSKWLHSLRFGGTGYTSLLSQEYFNIMHRYIEAVLPDADIRLAVLADNVDVALGFSVITGDMLEFIHVHRDNRRLGIGSKLIPADIKYYAFRTNYSDGFINKVFPHLTYKPGA